MLVRFEICVSIRNVSTSMLIGVEMEFCKLISERNVIQRIQIKQDGETEGVMHLVNRSIMNLQYVRVIIMGRFLII